jgi:DNA-3-methyladenine glycosylase I
VNAERCGWAGTDPLNIAYHDEEWGRPVHDESRLFELLTLEGAQAGLSWLTVLRKRDGYRQAFAGFDPQRVAGFDQDRVERLLHNPGIVRHRGKIEATVRNARRILALWETGQTLSGFVWDFVDGRPLLNEWTSMPQLPSCSPLSRAMSRAFKKAGFRFVGETTCYAFMQAAGLVNDHLLSCPARPACLLREPPGSGAG